MHGLEEVLAVGGFWLCMILLIFRTAIKERIISAPAKNNVELSEMKTRMQALENRIAIMNTEILELREVQDFDRRLSGKSESMSLLSARTVTTSAAGAGKLRQP